MPGEEHSPLSEAYVVGYDQGDQNYPIVARKVDPRIEFPVPADLAVCTDPRWNTHRFTGITPIVDDRRVLWNFFLLPGPIAQVDAWDEERRVQVSTFRQRVVTATAPVPQVGSTYSTASIIVHNSVASLVVMDPGSGYVAIPTLTIAASSGGGTQATGTVTSLKVVSAVPAAFGSGYVPGDTITFTGGTFTTAAVATVSSSTLSTLALNAAGTGYNSGDVITLQGGTATQNATLSVSTTKLVSLALNAPGTGMVPGATLTLVGGTFNTAATLTISTTKVVSATVAAAGGSGTPGTQTVTGTTGTGTKFQASVTVDGGGTVTAVLSITVAGSYTVNPTSIANEPVTGAGLVGAQLAVVMGVATFAIASGGAYTLNSTTFTSTGGGNDATFQTGVFGIGTFSILQGGSYTASTSTFTQQSVAPVGGLGATFQSATYTVGELTVTTAGAYTVIPGNPTAQGSTSGAGTGLTAVLSFGIGAATVGTAGTLYYYTPSVTLSFGNAQVAAVSDSLTILPGQTGYVVDNGLEEIDSLTSWMIWVTMPLPPTIVYYSYDFANIPQLLFSIVHYVYCVPPNVLPENPTINTTYNKIGGNAQLRLHRHTISYSLTAPTSFAYNTWQTQDLRYDGVYIKINQSGVLNDHITYQAAATSNGCDFIEAYTFQATTPSASGFAGHYYTLGSDPKPDRGKMFRTETREFLA